MKNDDVRELSDADLERVAAGKLVKATFTTAVVVNASLLPATPSRPRGRFGGTRRL